ncbi:hypothetical protein BB402_00470 [Helicobacter pylori]|nr:hypothetical protein BB402_00470 [Helicobacter pylori]
MPILAQELKPFPNDEKMILVVLKKHPIHSKRFSTGSFNFSRGCFHLGFINRVIKLLFIFKK